MSTASGGPPPGAIQDFYRRWKIGERWRFGSILRDAGPHEADDREGRRADADDDGDREEVRRVTTGVVPNLLERGNARATPGRLEAASDSGGLSLARTSDRSGTDESPSRRTR